MHPAKGPIMKKLALVLVVALAAFTGVSASHDTTQQTATPCCKASAV